MRALTRRLCHMEVTYDLRPQDADLAAGHSVLPPGRSLCATLVAVGLRQVLWPGLLAPQAMGAGSAATSHLDVRDQCLCLRHHVESLSPGSPRRSRESEGLDAARGG